MRAWRSTGPNYPNRQTRPHPPRHDGLPCRPYCPPRNDKHLRTNTTLVIASPLRAWRSTGPHYPNRQTRPRPPRHDGLPLPSLRSLLAMTKCELQYLNSLHGKNTTPCHRDLSSLLSSRAPPFPILSSRGLKARGDPLALSKRTDKHARISRDTMDCRVGHLHSLLAMTM